MGHSAQAATTPPWEFQTRQRLNERQSARLGGSGSYSTQSPCIFNQEQGSFFIAIWNQTEKGCRGAAQPSSAPALGDGQRI